MLKNLVILGTLGLLAAGCSREVYLQSVPCTNGCQPCPATEVCTEIAEQTEIQKFVVYDVPAKPVKYIPCEEQTSPDKRCRKVCREVSVK